MPSKISAGIVLYLPPPATLHVLLVHPGGPFFVKKDHGHWSIPKGAANDGEPLQLAARRELFEETGIELAEDAPLLSLGSITQRGGKVVHAWASPYTGPLNFIHSSNEFEMEWPPRSGIRSLYPEVDKAEFFSMSEAEIKLMESQVPLLHRLHHLV
jgi:predicted NUDIX family NTP pyrophosphohydrolase